MLQLLSFCVANAHPWLGLQIGSPGPVVYCAAEGSGGLPPRWRAIKKMLGLPLDRPSGVTTFPAAVNLLDNAVVDAFVNLVEPLQPKLVIIDTLARCLIGGDENSAQDMGRAMASCERIASELDCSVVVAHHCRANGERERGSSALRGACDTMVELRKKGSRVVMRVEKQRDLPHASPIALEIVPVDGTDSVCVRLADNAVTGDVPGLSGREHTVLETLRHKGNLSVGQLRAALPSYPRSSLCRALDNLRRRGVVGTDGARYCVLDECLDSSET